MHHERIGPSPRQPFGSEAIEHVIFARGGDECAIHPFMLQAQHHHYISAFQPFVELSESSRTHLLRSVERRVGKECVSKRRYTWSPYHSKIKKSTVNPSIQ